MSDLPEWMKCSHCDIKTEYPVHCERCDIEFCDDCWWSARATLTPKNKNLNVKHMHICTDCHKKQWFKSKYGMMYSMALRKSKEKDRNLWFDPRGWTDKDIAKFFKHLDYVDSDTYECLVKKIPHTRYRLCRRANSHKKYLKYCQEQYNLVSNYYYD